MCLRAQGQRCRPGDCLNSVQVQMALRCRCGCQVLAKEELQGPRSCLHDSRAGQGEDSATALRAHHGAGVRFGWLERFTFHACARSVLSEGWGYSVPVSDWAGE
eukprot:9211034-Alexandrium_andersonii.AAC.1